MAGTRFDGERVLIRHMFARYLHFSRPSPEPPGQGMPC
jgi:hypothetical protein